MTAAGIPQPATRNDTSCLSSEHIQHVVRARHAHCPLNKRHALEHALSSAHLTVPTPHCTSSTTFRVQPSNTQCMEYYPMLGRRHFPLLLPITAALSTQSFCPRLPPGLQQAKDPLGHSHTASQLGHSDTRGPATQPSSASPHLLQKWTPRGRRATGPPCPPCPPQPAGGHPPGQGGRPCRRCRPWSSLPRRPLLGWRAGRLPETSRGHQGAPCRPPIEIWSGATAGRRAR
jgi:hypothetical protein